MEVGFEVARTNNAAVGIGLEFTRTHNANAKVPWISEAAVKIEI